MAVSGASPGRGISCSSGVAAAALAVRARRAGDHGAHLSVHRSTARSEAGLELQTTLVDAAISFNLTPGASLTVAAESAPDAQIIGTNLFVYTSGPVVLELTSETAGEAAASFARIHPQTDDLAWAQSPELGHDDKACQVFSHFESTALRQ